MFGKCLRCTKDYTIGVSVYCLLVAEFPSDFFKDENHYRVTLEQRFKTNYSNAVHEFVYEFNSFEQALKFVQNVEDCLSALEVKLGA